MRIKIEWNEDGRRGHLEYDVDALIKNMGLAGFKKWSKLFAIYGKPEQHHMVLSLIQNCYLEEYDNLNMVLSKKDDQAVKRTQKKMHFYNRKYEILLGLLQ